MHSEVEMVVVGSPVNRLAIESSLDVRGAIDRRLELLEALAALQPGDRAEVELTAPEATAPAIQLAAALRKSLLARSAFSGFGPNAHSTLAGKI